MVGTTELRLRMKSAENYIRNMQRQQTSNAYPAGFTIVSNESARDLALKTCSLSCVLNLGSVQLHA
jgi:hypothetical protein